MSSKMVRPIAPDLHPIATGNYRIATPAIEEFCELVTRCLRYRTTGALIYGPSRIGKTRAIEYVRPLLAETYPTLNTPRQAQRDCHTGVTERCISILEYSATERPSAG